MKQDRRRSQRTLSSVPLDLYDSKDRMVIGEGELVNISEKGAMMRSRNLLKPKVKICLHMAPARKAALELTGRVIWTQKNRGKFTYGVLFDPLSAS